MFVEHRSSRWGFPRVFNRREVALGLGVSMASLATSRAQAVGDPEPFRILSIDGGGIKGIVPATILVELDRRLVAAGKKGVVDNFNLFAGTSTGCIIAAALATWGTARKKFEKLEEIPAIYRDQGGAIFKPHSALWERLRKDPVDWWGQSYSSAGKQKIFDEVFGPLILRDLRHNFIGTFYRMGPETPGAAYAYGGPGFAAAGLHDFDAWRLQDIVEASSSAPVYFNPTVVTDGNITAIDGGVFANNPAAGAYAVSRPLWEGRPVVVVALGCGRGKITYPHRGTWGPAEWAAPSGGDIPLLNAMFDSQSSSVDQQMQALLPKAYHRLQPDLNLGDGKSMQSHKALGAMDDPSPDNLNALVRAAYWFIESHSDKLDAAVAAL
jgi:predicted acylesterase/phospholipase RssA